LQNLGRISSRWLGDEEMHVFGHYDISDEFKAMPGADFLEIFTKRSGASGEWPTAVTTEGDKMKIAAPVESPQRIAQRSHSVAKANPARLTPPFEAQGKKGAALALTYDTYSGSWSNNILYAASRTKRFCAPPRRAQKGREEEPTHLLFFSIS
jgi:hypothetical protein